MQHLILFSGTTLMADLMLFSPQSANSSSCPGFSKGAFVRFILGGNIQDKILIFPKRTSSAPLCLSKQINIHFLKMCGHRKLFCVLFSSFNPRLKPLNWELTVKKNVIWSEKLKYAVPKYDYQITDFPVDNWSSSTFSFFQRLKYWHPAGSACLNCFKSPNPTFKWDKTPEEHHVDF